VLQSPRHCAVKIRDQVRRRTPGPTGEPQIDTRLEPSTASPLYQKSPSFSRPAPVQPQPARLEPCVLFKAHGTRPVNNNRLRAAESDDAPDRQVGITFLQFLLGST
jgi:hypothetical protein